MDGKILIFDGHRLNLEVFTQVLEREKHLQHYHIKGVKETLHISNADADEVKLMILNVCGFFTSGIKELLDELKTKSNKIPIMIISKQAEPSAIKKCYEAGVKCFLGKDTELDEFRFAIKQVLEGKVYITEEVKLAFLESLVKTETEKEKKHQLSDELTSREKDVLKLLCEGMKSREIAEKLFISTHTVDSHKRNIMLKCGVNSISKLVKYSLENQMI